MHQGCYTAYREGLRATEVASLAVMSISLGYFYTASNLGLLFMEPWVAAKKDLRQSGGATTSSPVPSQISLALGIYLTAE